MRQRPPGACLQAELSQRAGSTQPEPCRAHVLFLNIAFFLRNLLDFFSTRGRHF